MIFYVNQDFPCQTFNNSTFPNSLKFLPLEINLRNKKIFGIDCCKLPLLDDEYFLDQSSFHSTAYDNFLLLGVFNISRDDERLKEFCNSFSLGLLILPSRHRT